jgi:GT2 family glycosyltransferase
MTSTKKIAIVILNWNGAHLFPEFLPSIVRHSSGEGITIHIADNGSTDNSLAWLRENFPAINLIKLEQNYGFAQGYNLALRKVDADFFVLINSDVEVTPGWLAPCIDRLEAHPRMAALQPKILSYTKKTNFEYAGAAGGYLDRWGFPFCRGRILSVTEKDEGQYDQPASLLWATGACLVIKASAFMKSGGFDEDFFAHMEEIDLCWRLKNQGWTIGFEPGSTVYHLGGATLSYHSPRKVYLNFRNNLWMLMKNLPENRLFPTLFFRMLLDGVAAFHFLATGKLKAFQAVIQAHYSFYATFKKFYKKRQLLQKRITCPKHPEIFKGSMVYHYYILKIRNFSGLRFHPPMEMNE